MIPDPSGWIVPAESTFQAFIPSLLIQIEANLRKTGFFDRLDYGKSLSISTLNYNNRKSLCS